MSYGRFKYLRTEKTNDEVYEWWVKNENDLYGHAEGVSLWKWKKGWTVCEYFLEADEGWVPSFNTPEEAVAYWELTQ